MRISSGVQEALKSPGSFGSQARDRYQRTGLRRTGWVQEEGACLFGTALMEGGR